MLGFVGVSKPVLKVGIVCRLPRNLSNSFIAPTAQLNIAVQHWNQRREIWRVNVNARRLRIIFQTELFGEPVTERVEWTLVIFAKPA